jgi:hypothetical protein
MTAHVVYSAGEWRRVGMDNQQCDRHPSARAKARVLFPNLCVLYMCAHCERALKRDYHGDFHITYETMTV